MYLTMVVYIGTPEAPNVRPSLSSLSSPPVTTQGNPVELVGLDMLHFFYNPAKCNNQSRHDFLAQASEQTKSDLFQLFFNNTFDSAKAEVLWLHTLDHDRVV